MSSKQIYKKSYKIAKDILNKYGTKINEILYSGCYEVILGLLENNYIDSFIKSYMEATKDYMITGAIDLNHTNLRNIRTISSAPIDLFIQKYLVNIRIKLTFIHEAMHFFMYKIKDIGEIYKIFDSCSGYRVLRDEYKSDFCLTGFNHKTLPVSKDYKDLGAKDREDCFGMFKPLEKYSKLEKMVYHSTSQEFVPGINKFSKPNMNTKANVEDNPDHVFVAGISGHTMNILTFYSMFVIDITNPRNEIILKYLIMACIVWMIPYYHHSIREIAINLSIFIDPEDELLAQTFELFNNNIQLSAQYDKFQDILNQLPIIDHTIWNDGAVYSVQDIVSYKKYIQDTKDKLNTLRYKLETIIKSRIDNQQNLILPPIKNCKQ